MTLRRRIDPDDSGDGHEHGFGGFLRSLLSGIPWSERADRRRAHRDRRPREPSTARPQHERTHHA